MVLGTLAVAAACTAVTFILPKTYTSEALIFVEPREARADASALDVLERLGSGHRIGTELELIRSRPVVESSVERANLNARLESDGRAIDPNTLFTTYSVSRNAIPGTIPLKLVDVPVKGDPKGSRSPLAEWGITAERRSEVALDSVVVTVLPFQLAVDSALRRISVQKVHRDASLLRVTCSGRSRTSATDLCRHVIDSYLKLRTDLQRTDAFDTATFLRAQVERVGTQLSAAEDSLEVFVRNQGAVALAEQATEQVRSLARLREDRARLDAERNSVRNVIAAIERDERGSSKYRDLASIPRLLDNEVITGLLSTLTELENRRSDLMLRRAPTNVDIQSIDTRIVEIELQLKSVATSYNVALAAKVRSLDRSLNTSTERMAELPGRQTRVAQLTREYDSLNGLYKTLEARLQQAEVAKGIALPGVRVVGEPTVPFKASSPSLPRNVALGLMLGSVYGLGLGLVREARDKTLRSLSEVESHTGLPVLGVIPHVRRPGPVVRVEHSDRGPIGADGLIGQELPEPNDDVGTTLAREAFRSLVVDLGFVSGRRGGAARSVAVTSAERAAGKTFTSCNLALVKAAHGARTLLIDGDMRASGVAHFFNLPPATPGLSDVLSRDVSLMNLLHTMKVGNSELWVLPAGRPTESASSLLDGERFRLLITSAAEKFDFVIVDCPPLSLITDAASISAAVDGILVIVREGSTERAAIDHTLARIRRAGANAVGAVFNDVHPSASQGRQYADYSREANS